MYLNRVYVFLCIVLLAVRMVADVTETRNVIPSLEFNTRTTKKTVLSPTCVEPFSFLMSSSVNVKKSLYDPYLY